MAFDKGKVLMGDKQDKILKKPNNCACQVKLPWHLFEIGPLKHTCSCGRVYDRENENEVKLIGFDQGWKESITEIERQQTRQVNEPSGYRVYLTYFRPNGKYECEGSYHSAKEELWEIFDEVEDLLRISRLPGLIEDHSDFIVLVEVPEHKHNHPHLVMEDKNEA
jgi:hypothetical protein